MSMAVCAVFGALWRYWHADQGPEETRWLCLVPPWVRLDFGFGAPLAHDINRLSIFILRGAVARHV